MSSEGISGVVNELLIQLQSFDTPAGGSRVQARAIDLANRFLPAHRRLKKKPPMFSNILVIGATNRAADLDPALLRPGRFDRSIHFDLPSRAAAGARSSTTTSTARRTCPSSTRKSAATCSRR